MSIAYRWLLAAAPLVTGAAELQLSDLPQVSQQLAALKLKKRARELTVSLLEKRRLCAF